MREVEAAQRRLAVAAAVLFAGSMATGALAGLVMSGKVPGDGRTVLAAHVASALGCAVMLGMAWSLKLSGLGPGATGLMVALTILANYVNWLVTAGKAFIRVHGIDLVPGETANNAVFLALTAGVVLPSFAAGALWVWGLWKGPAAAPPGS